MIKLNAQHSLQSIDHMTHIDNLGTILKNGLMSHNNPFQKVDISNQTVNSRRDRIEPVNKKSVHDYVPFYFNARNAMLYSTQQRFDEDVIILGFDPEILNSKNAIFTDGNAACNDTQYYATTNRAKLLNIDWDNVFSDSWYDFNAGCADHELKRQMMAETLIPGKVDAQHISYIFCQSSVMRSYLSRNFDLSGIKVISEPCMFF